ncbi:hypothetical protein [Candidatus Frankia alpina]|uniref:hypothetical protein n=1 Tax=Candidatus Frankia alpina TaxID=2699483 RepID=UPI0013D0C682|nr:hypothetical protein [Candidatus Frankia alpina]
MGLGGGGAARLLRGTVFALACTGLAAAAHALAHGGAPAPAALVMAVGAVAILAAPFAGRTRTLPTVVAAMVAVQAGLHTLFSLAPFAGSTGRMSAALRSTLCMSPGGEIPDAVVRRLLRAQAPLLPAPPAMPIAPWHGGPLMLGAHLLAAAAMAALLHRCDDAVSTAARLATVTLSAATVALAVLLGRTTTDPVAVAVHRLLRAPGRPPNHRPPPSWLCHARVLRGPPRPPAATSTPC